MSIIGPDHHHQRPQRYMSHTIYIYSCFRCCCTKQFFPSRIIKVLQTSLPKHTECRTYREGRKSIAAHAVGTKQNRKFAFVLLVRIHKKFCRFQILILKYSKSRACNIVHFVWAWLGSNPTSAQRTSELLLMEQLNHPVVREGWAPPCEGRDEELSWRQWTFPSTPNSLGPLVEPYSAGVGWSVELGPVEVLILSFVERWEETHFKWSGGECASCSGSNSPAGRGGWIDLITCHFSHSGLVWREGSRLSKHWDSILLKPPPPRCTFSSPVKLEFYSIQRNIRRQRRKFVGEKRLPQLSSVQTSPQLLRNEPPF